MRDRLVETSELLDWIEEDWVGVCELADADGIDEGSRLDVVADFVVNPGTEPFRTWSLTPERALYANRVLRPRVVRRQRPLSADNGRARDHGTTVVGDGTGRSMKKLARLGSRLGDRRDRYL